MIDKLTSLGKSFFQSRTPKASNPEAGGSASFMLQSMKKDGTPRPEVEMRVSASTDSETADCHAHFHTSKRIHSSSDTDTDTNTSTSTSTSVVTAPEAETASINYFHTSTEIHSSSDTDTNTSTSVVTAPAPATETATETETATATETATETETASIYYAQKTDQELIEILESKEQVVDFAKHLIQSGADSLLERLLTLKSDNTPAVLCAYGNDDTNLLQEMIKANWTSGVEACLKNETIRIQVNQNPCKYWEAVYDPLFTGNLACTKPDSWKRAQETLDLFLKNGVSPDSFGTKKQDLIKRMEQGFKQAGKYDLNKGKKTIDKLRDLHTSMNRQHVYQLLHSLCNCMSEAELFNKFKEGCVLYHDKTVEQNNARQVYCNDKLKELQQCLDIALAMIKKLKEHGAHFVVLTKFEVCDIKQGAFKTPKIMTGEGLLCAKNWANGNPNLSNPPHNKRVFGHPNLHINLLSDNNYQIFLDVYELLNDQLPQVHQQEITEKLAETRAQRPRLTKTAFEESTKFIDQSMQANNT